MHGTQLFCMAGTADVQMLTTMTQTTDVPVSFTGCHNHGPATYCIGANGDDVELGSAEGEAAPPGGQAHDHDHAAGDAAGGGHRHCHFHAGVEHCVGGGESESGPAQCDGVKRDYNVPLRVGLLFAIMATSALGVFGPILIQSYLPRKLDLVFVILKQFGTGIIISTAFVHLYTHASLMFANKCIGELKYESTTSAIVMAGLFLSFVVEYIGQRIVQAKFKSSAAVTPEERAKAFLSSEVVNILVMEAGILFHSLLIGLTLVVAGDSFFVTLFVVILFHQVFEGLALGTRIATVGTVNHASGGAGAASSASASSLTGGGHGDEAVGREDVDKSHGLATAGGPSSALAGRSLGLSMKKKLGLAALFAFVTPIGMAIGIGVLQKFNGNDKSTLIAIGTLDALSAGILVWVGVVEMWAADWMGGGGGGHGHSHKAELADAGLLTTALALFGLLAGMVLMSVLGKWA
ncbi:hypothetical protein CDD83_1476 [Cordyceps sp. RAO-2017]|nr:hypothetical protein CDD83_1476 [Cordyceps sp. RAO-2017]